MRTMIRILLGLLGVGFIALAAVSYIQHKDGTSGVFEVADKFTKALNNKNMDQAYPYLSRELAASTTKQEIQEYLEKNAIDKFSNIGSWSHSTNGERHILTGFATSRDNYVVPVVIELTREDNTWKIYSLLASTRVPKMPSNEVLLQLASQSIFAFTESVNEKSMARFYKQISTLWQNNTTIENLNRDFGPFYGAGGALAALRQQTPQFDPKPTIDQNGHLLLAGNYPRTPKVHFEQKYILEDGKWKLISFSISI